VLSLAWREKNAKGPMATMATMGPMAPEGPYSGVGLVCWLALKCAGWAWCVLVGLLGPIGPMRPMSPMGPMGPTGPIRRQTISKTYIALEGSKFDPDRQKKNEN
jgi:hypothetical protein